MKAQIYLLITIALATLLLSCGPKDTEPSASSAGATGGDGLSTAALQAIIKSGNLAGLDVNTDSLVTNTLTYLTDSTNYASVKIEARYATENGSGDYSGNNWENAIAATNLRKAISNISDATDSKVYAVLVAGGTYKPVDATATVTAAQRVISFTMKNHVAIIGGFAASGSWTRSGTTTFSGDIGTEGSTTDNTYHVFSHTSINLTNGLLYGVTITKGNANGAIGGGMFNVSSSPRLVNVVFSDNSAGSGGGMYNKGSFPRLVNVVFSDNSAGSGGGMYNTSGSSPRLVGVRFVGNSASTVHGGGMYNNSSSPVLTRVEFTSNSAHNGGGMYNNASSPVLTGVEFAGNSTGSGGGGMYNNSGSSPVLTGVEFTSNSAVLSGGGMLNSDSSPVLRGVVFAGNSATEQGGGMWNSNTPTVLVGVVFRGNSSKSGGAIYDFSGANGPVIVNSIFEDNRVTTGVGEDIVLDRTSSSFVNNINIRVAGSVLGIGTANATNGIVIVTNRGLSYNITYHSLTNGAVDFGSDTTTGGLTYPTILDGSSAKDIGLYVRKSGNNYYFSDDENTWYTEFSATGGFGAAVALPGGTEDLTATDIAGNARNGRPDAGVSEYATP